ncbi:MAG TPA: response regulator [Thermoanaerobaculia bacterium]
MPPPSDTPGPRILIVDDLKSNLRLLEQTLRRAAYVEVMSTLDPCEVAALHLQHRYDLILLDLQMPEMNGFEVMAKLREVRAENPVAILVLSADPAQKRAALDAGADSFMGKPFRLPEVVERVQSILGTGA